MRLPEMMPARPAADRSAAVQAAPDVAEQVELAGCCAQVCTPFTGCHCVHESPLCP